MGVSVVDGEVLRAVRAHVAGVHGRGLDAGEVVLERKGRLAAATCVTVVAETAGSPAWFSCLLCAEGARRYRVDLFATPLEPPERHVRAIRSHFAERHAVELGEEGIYRGPALAERAVCTYLPSMPRRGAAFLCELCAEGMGRIVLEEPAYGDARRLAWLLRMRPELHAEVLGLGPVARAERLEAIDRGVVPAVGRVAVGRAVRRARRGPPACQSGPIEQALEVLLAERVAAGAGPTAVIKALVVLMEDDPLGYGRALAEAMPDMSGSLSLRDDHLTGLLIQLYGRLERTDRALWTTWGRVRDSQSARAGPGGG